MEFLVALVSALIGGGLATLLTHLRATKSDREKWENFVRGGYRDLLMRIDEYRCTESPGADEWRRAYRDTHTHVLTSGSNDVAALLLTEQLRDPEPPNGSASLLSGEDYIALVAKMRSEVVPPERDPKGLVT